MGLDTESSQTQRVTKGVFVVQFFNTALLLLLCSSNLQEQGTIVGAIFSGSLPDFNADWFNEIGYNLAYAMAFNMFWPVMEFFAFWGMRYGFRMLDRGVTSCNEYKTKKTTLQPYIELYSGPVFFIHYKYSFILNVVFVTFMYGMGIPVLFPIAAGSFLVLYAIEKAMIYYSYRQPPMYDDKLNTQVLALLTWAPLLMMSFGYWMMSNKQLLSNDNLNFVTQARDIRLTYHVWTQAFTSDGY